MRRWILLVVFLCQSAVCAQDSLRIPAFTAYLDPNPRGASVSERSGITRFRDPATRVLWFGEFKSAGIVDCSVELRLPPNASTTLKLAVADQSVKSTAKADATGKAVAEFRAFHIVAPGCVQFTLESLNAGKPVGDVDALVVTGPAIKDAISISKHGAMPRRCICITRFRRA